MIDFTNCEINKFKYYGGKNCSKICIVYNNQDYMLKFPSLNDNDAEQTYANNCISEYVACKIIKSLGFKVQDTILGTYNLNGNTKVVVACKDFTSLGVVLRQFAELKNSQIESFKNGYGTELEEVIQTIESQQICDVNYLKDFFWDMFIADTLVGNFNRHNGNWGFLINERLKEVEIAPIYDCASSLYPQLTDERMKKIIDDEEEMNARVFVFPNSALKIDDKKINYYDFISSLDNVDCNKALLRVFPRINLNVINEIIDNTLYISDIRKEFYKKIIKMRYDLLLKVNYNKLISKEG